MAAPGIDPSLVQVIGQLVTTLEANNGALQALNLTTTPALGAGSLGLQAAVEAGVGAAMAAATLNLSDTSIRQIVDGTRQVAADQVAASAGAAAWGSGAGGSARSRRRRWGAGSTGRPRSAVGAGRSGATDVPPAPPSASGAAPGHADLTEASMREWGFTGETGAPLGSLLEGAAAGEVFDAAGGSSSVAPPPTGSKSGSKTAPLFTHLGKVGDKGLSGTRKPTSLADHLTSTLSRHYSRHREVAYYQDPADPSKYNTVNPMNQVMRRGLSAEEASAAVATGRTGPAAILHSALDSSSLSGAAGAALGATAETAATAGGAAAGGLAAAVLANPELDIAGMVLGAVGDLAAQRQKNSVYSSIYGTNNIGGAAQRLNETAFRFSRFGQITGAQAQQLFEGVSATGLQGQQRATGLQAAMTLYNDQGVTFANTVAAITASVQAGNPTLAGLADSISAVATAAKQAGVNVDQATQSFVQGIQTLGQAGVTGPGGSVLSAANTAAAANLGPTYKNLGSAMTAMEANPTIQAVVGQANGLTQEQVIAKAQTDPQAVTEMFQRYALSPAMAGATPQLLSYARSYVAAHPHESTAQMMQGLISGAESRNLIANGSLSSMAQKLSIDSGVNFTAQDAAGFVAGSVLDQVTGGKKGLNLTTQVRHAVHPIAGPYKPPPKAVGHWVMRPGGMAVWEGPAMGVSGSSSPAAHVAHHVVHAHSTEPAKALSAAEKAKERSVHATAAEAKKRREAAFSGPSGSSLDAAVKGSVKHQVTISMTPETRKYFAAISSAVNDLSARQSLNEAVPAPQHPRAGNRAGNIHQ